MFLFALQNFGPFVAQRWQSHENFNDKSDSEEFIEDFRWHTSRGSLLSLSYCHYSLLFLFFLYTFHYRFYSADLYQFSTRVWIISIVIILSFFIIILILFLLHTFLYFLLIRHDIYHFSHRFRVTVIIIMLSFFISILIFISFLYFS